MANKPILTKEQFHAKCDEFNDIPKENKHTGMRMGLNCEHVRDLLSYAWNYAKETATEAGKTDLDDIYIGFYIFIIKTMLESIGAPPMVIEVLADKLKVNSILTGMIWHVFSEVAPEEDVTLLTGSFDLYSEASNG